MSGPNVAPPIPDISILSTQPVPFPKELTEAEMMSMTIEELEAYSAKVSTSIGLEYSTLQSYQAIQDAIDRSVLQSQSTIAGIDTELVQNEIVLGTAKTRKRDLDTEIAVLDTAIVSYTSTIAGLDIEIADTDKTISSLQLESDTLATELAASDAAFTKAASAYSTLVYDYIAKEATYQQQLSSIQAESTFLSAALVEEAETLAIYNSTVGSYTQLSGEVDALTKQSTEIQSSLTQFKVIETQAIANLQSTTIAINSLSSLYETSLTMQAYYQAVSTQSAAIEAFTNASALFTQASRNVDLYPTQKIYQDAKTLAQNQLNTAAVEKNRTTAAVQQLQALVNVSQSDSYEAILKGYQDTIDLETLNVSTFSGRRLEAETDIRRFSTLFDSAQADIAMYNSSISTFSAQYNSSITGANLLTLAAASFDSTVTGQQTILNRLDAEIRNFSTIYEQEISSFNGYINVSTQKKAEFDQAVIDLRNFSTFFESTSVALVSLTAEETRLRGVITSNDNVIKAQSTVYEREMVKQEAFQSIIEISLAEQELAAMQYRETFARAKKIAVQELYNTRVLQAVQAVSTQNGTTRATLPAGAPFVPAAVDMNRSDLKQAFGTVTSINTFISNFTAIYDAYSTQIAQLADLSTTITDKSVALETIFTARTALDAAPTDTTRQTSLTTANASLSAVQGRINTVKSNVATAKSSVQQMIQSFSTAYTSLFTGAEIIAQSSTISSFLEAGHKSAVTI